MRREPSQPPDLPGYTYVSLLGSGGFSDVFLYEQKLPRRKVAVKVLIAEGLTKATRRAFVTEANVMAQLSTHPYIVTIYQADVTPDGRPYFVLEYCSGPSLSEQYKSQPLTVADALRTGIRISGAVATAHQAGILHRDIKPANVLGNDYGWPALTDFGISSAIEEDVFETTFEVPIGSTTEREGDGLVGMSVPWSPPEMFEDDPQPDVRSDLFSLAATVYTALAGHTPFEVRGHSNTVIDLIGRIERGAITPMARTDIPASLNAVLRKGMATDPTDRFATVVEFARALQRVELELGYQPTPIDVPSLTTTNAPERVDEDDRDRTGPRSAELQEPDEGRTVVVERPSFARRAEGARQPEVGSSHPPPKKASAVPQPPPPPPIPPQPTPSPPRSAASAPVGPPERKLVNFTRSVVPKSMMAKIYPESESGWRLELLDRIVELKRAALLGRAPVGTPDFRGAEMIVIDDPNHSVSTTHALIEIREGEPWISDLNSTNGVWILPADGEPIEVEPAGTVAVPDGATLELGEYVIRVTRS